MRSDLRIIKHALLLIEGGSAVSSVGPDRLPPFRIHKAVTLMAYVLRSSLAGRADKDFASWFVMQDTLSIVASTNLVGPLHVGWGRHDHHVVWFMLNGI